MAICIQEKIEVEKTRYVGIEVATRSYVTTDGKEWLDRSKAAHHETVLRVTQMMQKSEGLEHFTELEATAEWIVAHLRDLTELEIESRQIVTY